MVERGFIVLSDAEFEWACQRFGLRYADRMRTACRKVETSCIRKGISINETNERMRKTCLRILADFDRNGDPCADSGVVIGDSDYHLTDEDIKKELDWRKNPWKPSHDSSVIGW